jgi:hypothetical protein
MKHITGVAVLALSQAAWADSITLVASRDNTLYQHAAGAFSNGAGEFLFAGVTRLSEIRRIVLRFDLSSIPPRSTVDSARLVLEVDRSVTPAADFAIHRLVADWGEDASNAGDPGGLGAPSQPGDATWIHRFYDTVFWVTPGGDFVATPSATATVPVLGAAEWGPDPAMTADVQDWLDNPAGNFGWLIRAADESVANAKRLFSRENPLTHLRPRLIVEYTPPCPGSGPGACGPADWNEDGVVDFNDLLEYLNAFNAQNPCADLNGDAVIDFNDFLEYLNLFNAGC